jgi:hypothetical protein
MWSAGACVRQAIYRAHRNDSRLLIMTFDNGVQEKLPFERHVANYAESKFCLAPAGYGFSLRQYECVLHYACPAPPSPALAILAPHPCMSCFPSRRSSTRCRDWHVPMTWHAG